VQELPRKTFYKLSEVCQYTDTQPYVLRFWENEFPQLNPDRSASGQRLYRKRDIDVVRRIKELLYQEDYTLDDARKKLGDEVAGGKRPKLVHPDAVGLAEAGRPDPPVPPARRPSAVHAPRKKIDEAPAASVPEAGTVSRQRYETAVDEIDHLRSALREAERNQRRAEATAEESQQAAAGDCKRAETAIARLERVHEILSS
jgi:DNA-binding transcriptional MerR regulator